MEDILIQGLLNLLKEFPEADFSMIYYSNNTNDLAIVTDEILKTQGDD